MVRMKIEVIPNSNARPVWFIMYDYLTVDFLKSLIGIKGSNDEKIIKSISFNNKDKKHRNNFNFFIFKSSFYTLSKAFL